MASIYINQKKLVPLKFMEFEEDDNHEDDNLLDISVEPSGDDIE